MIQKLKTAFASLALIGALAMPALAVPAVVYASDFDASRTAACEAISAGSNCNQGNADGRVRGLLSTIVGILSAVVGIAAVIMIIISGFKYVTAGGDSNNISSAKNTLIYAIVGLIIVALAQFIVNFVLEQV